MSTQLREKTGRFIKQKRLSQKLNSLQAMSAAKKKHIQTAIQDNDVCNGRRIVEIKELAKNLVCCRCNEGLRLDDIENEYRQGLFSTLNIKCKKCFATTPVRTGKITKSSSFNNLNVNKTAVLGKFF